MIQQIDRKALKQEARELVRDAQVSPMSMTLLYLSLVLLLDMLSVFTADVQFLTTFLSILTRLMSSVLGAGFALYAMAIRRGERCEYLTLFDGFSFAGRIILLSLLVSLVTSLWAIAFLFPAVIMYYRYYFALYNLYENPGLGILQAMHLSARQTFGYKRQLLVLDLSYLGWGVLATFPALVYNGILYSESFRMTMSVMQGATGGVMPAMDPSVFLLPGWAWTLIAGLWTMVVSPFYMPHRRCVELAYFDIAKANVAEPTKPLLPK